MRFDLVIPDPVTMRGGKEAHVVLEPDTELHRFHPAVFDSDQFNDTDKGNARFSPIRDPSGTLVPTIYGAQSFACAACEVILRCPDVSPLAVGIGVPPLQIVFPSDFAGYRHSVVRTTVELRLVDVTAAGQRRIGISGNALLSGPRSTYSATRKWAERIHSACSNVHGLYYSSYQLGPEYAVVLFGDRLAAGALTTVMSRLVPDPPCHADLRVLAYGLSIDYEDV